MGISAKIAATAVAALLSGSVTALPATASDASSKAGAAVSASEPQIVAHGVEQFKRCYGHKVRRCLWVNVDHRRNRIRFYGKAYEGRTGRFYDVAINDLRANYSEWGSTLPPESQPRWVPGLVSGDWDGYHASADGAWSRLYGCVNGQNYSFTLKANFAWRNSGTGNTDSERERIYGSFNC